MNAEVRPAQPVSMKLNQMMLSGRIDHVSKFEGKFDHIITMPAADEFSKPSAVRVSASSKLGDESEMVKCLVHFNGWPNNYQNKKNEKVFDVRGFFVAVE
jgi:hypothetical protein